MKTTSFLCGLDRLNMRKVDQANSRKQYLLQAGQHEGNIALAIRNGSRDSVQLSSLAQDLIEIGVYLHQSDRLVERDLDSWSRSLDYHVAVSDVDRWESLAPLLGTISSFISGDQIRFNFHPRRHKPAWSSKIPKPQIAPSSVTLYSGGMDSSAGLSELLKRGIQTLAVTQYSNRLQDRADLLEDLGRVSGGTTPLIAFRVAPRRTRVLPYRGLQASQLRDVESTWRLRTFLYLALAGATADALHVNRILMFENGILAHNLPFDPFVIGARSTRHAHPRFLGLMEQLFQQLFQRSLTIRNPFQFLTKGSEAGRLAEFTLAMPDSPSLVARTNSCWYFPNLVARFAHLSGRPITHCGACMPCKIRRLAVLEAKLARWEPTAPQYFVDPLAEPLLESIRGRLSPIEQFAHEQHKRNLLRLQAYVQRINGCRSLNEFAHEWPQVFEFEGRNVSDQPVSSVVRGLYDLYSNFAHHADSVMTSYREAS